MHYVKLTWALVKLACVAAYDLDCSEEADKNDCQLYDDDTC